MSTAADHPPRVIVGVDGSEPATAALDWATAFAARHGQALHILSCYTAPFIGEPVMFAGYAVEAQIEGLRLEHEAIVERAVARVRARHRAFAVDGAACFEAPVTALPTAARSTDAIVVGSAGRSGLAGVLGSVATAVCHRAPCPVVVVPATWSSREEVPMNKIVVGVDGSATSAQALRWAVQEAALAGAELVVLHAWLYPYGEWAGRDEMALAAGHQLDEIVGLAPPDGGVTVTRLLVEDSPGKALIDASADADLVVVGSRGRGGFASLLLGSVSRAVVQHAACPVAVVRPRSA